MPKKEYIDPKEKLSEKYPNPTPIPCYTYDKDLKYELDNKNLTKEDSIEMLFQMILARRFDEMLLENKATNKYKDVEFEYNGPLHVSIGQEAVAVGQCWLLDKNDFIFGTHRNHAEVIAKGIRSIDKMDDQELTKIMENHWDGKVYNLIKDHHKFNSIKEEARFFFLYGVLAEIYTKDYGLNRGMGGSMHMFFTPFGIYPNNAVVGASPSIAIGAALFKLLNQKPGVVMANLGDGAISCGPVWESINFMAMDQYKELWPSPYNKRPPFMLNIINNQYAMGGQPDGETLGNKGSARFGMAINPEQMHAERVNGQNILAVIESQRRQIDLAKKGEGPILTEIMTYRFSGHSSADVNESYREKDEVAAWEQYDPITLFSNQLLDNEIIKKEDISKMENDIDQLLLDIYKLVVSIEKSPFPPFEQNDQLLDNLMFNPITKLDSESTKAVELSQPLEENARMIQLSKKARYIYDQDGKEVSPLRQYQIRDAIFEAVAQYAAEDPTLIIFGQEHRDWGGPYAVWRGMTELLPYQRFFNAIIGEAAIVGAAVGYAMCGGKSVVEIMYFDFLFRAGDEISNQMAKWRAMSGGILNMPLVLRVNIGATYGAQHSQDYTSVIAHIPGIKLVSPISPYDAKGLMKAALDDPNPVVFVETQNLYGYGERFVKEGVPKEQFSIPIGEPVLRQSGQDLTILTLGAALYPALEAAKFLEENHGITTDVIDARSAVPFNYDLVLKSLKKTGKIILINNGIERNNFMHHMASTISQMAFDDLDSAPVVLGARNWIMPGAGLDRFIYPQSSHIIDAINESIIPLKNFTPKSNSTITEMMRRNKFGV